MWTEPPQGGGAARGLGWARRGARAPSWRRSWRACRRPLPPGPPPPPPAPGWHWQDSTPGALAGLSNGSNRGAPPALLRGAHAGRRRQGPPPSRARAECLRPVTGEGARLWRRGAHRQRLLEVLGARRRRARPGCGRAGGEQRGAPSIPNPIPSLRACCAGRPWGQSRPSSSPDRARAVTSAAARGAAHPRRPPLPRGRPRPRRRRGPASCSRRARSPSCARARGGGGPRRRPG
jgi:hypothetical protein